MEPVLQARDTCQSILRNFITGKTLQPRDTGEAGSIKGIELPDNITGPMPGTKGVIARPPKTNATTGTGALYHIGHCNTVI